jgi:hypothetical protein
MEQAASGNTPSFANGTRLFVCILAVVYAAAFASVWVQADGLIGPAGILPAGQFFQLAREQFGRQAWFEAPSLCWIFGTGPFIGILCGLGIGVSALLFLGIAPAPSLALLWVSYLSLVSAGQTFFDFQWDGLLLETTLVAVFVVPWTIARARQPFDPPRLGRYLVWWLLFRLMFLSGVVKLTSGDRAWGHLTALSFHYETQPLPTPLAWYAFQLPAWFQVGSCAIMFLVELAAPFGIAAPRRIRHGAALAMIALQVAIALTGNYAYFNLLTIALCLTCLDDEWWRSRGWGVGIASEAPEGIKPAGVRIRATATRWFAAFAVGITFFEAAAAVSPGAAASPIVRALAEAVGPSRSFNNYGLFAVMTIERPELIFEGSDDGRDWREYTLPYKPGSLSRRPAWVAPHQPRLDWQLWFAALGSPDDNPWVARVCELLLRGDPAILGLFAHNPFPAHAPLYMRVVRYRYEFTSEEERARSGNWWRRTPIDFYMPALSLSPPTK